MSDTKPPTVVATTLPPSLNTITVSYHNHTQDIPLKRYLSEHIAQQTKQWPYGTAGFRAPADELAPVAMRVGITAALRSVSLGNCPIGVMVTASHNHVRDNGFKIIDNDGGMLNMDWEPIATALTNMDKDELYDFIRDAQFFDQGDTTSHKLTYLGLFNDIEDHNTHEYLNNTITITTDDIQTTFSIDNLLQAPSPIPHNRPIVIIGHDNRPSSIPLTQIIIDTALHCGAIVINYHLVTTPQLHWFVGCMNDAFFTKHPYNPLEQQQYNSFVYNPNIINIPERNVLTHHDYSMQFGDAFYDLYSTFSQNTPKTNVYVDSAYGVGFYAFNAVNQYLTQKDPQFISQVLEICPVLSPTTTSAVNDRAGIDYALKTHGECLRPELDACLSLTKDFQSKEKNYVFGVDGDCDRLCGIIITQPNDLIRFIDGDKVAVLFIEFLSLLLTKLHLSEKFSIGLIQTAYCNGASCHYIHNTYPFVKQSKACTGVKYLLQQTIQYDIAVYFEPNGHGAIKFNQSTFLSKIMRYFTQCNEQNKDLVLLSKLYQLMNPFIGDGCSDLLFILVAMAYLQLTPLDVFQRYNNYATLQTILKVEDKNKIVADKDLAEERLIEPLQLQEAIDQIIAQYAVYNARSFVRPSGTENVVRVFVESSNDNITEKITQLIKEIVPFHA